MQRTLDLLVSQEKLVEKVYGKQKVYLANQAQFPDFPQEDLKQMDRKMAELQEVLKRQTAECRGMETRLSSLRESLTLEEAKKQLETVTKECSDMEARLHAAKSSKDAVSPEESIKIHKGYRDSVQNWRKRKRMATDIVSAILEGYPKSKKELIEEVGIETDEDYNVSIPTT